MPRAAGTDSTSTPASKARISLRADIDKLMDYFLLTESVRYQEFARVWKALNFALIYVGLRDTKDKKEFIQDAFELVSEYLQPPFDLQRRVCALYTLYGLYYTQTHHPRIKIRMSLEDWKETLALHDDLQEQGHLDALYIFHKMRLDKAFMFTATHAPMFYQGRAKKPEDFERWAAKHQSLMASVLDEDLLQELEQVHTAYKAGKQVSDLQNDASLAIVQDSMSDFIMERISNIDVPKETDVETQAVAESRTRSSRIREIKKRSFASPTQMSKARRTRDESTTDDPTYSPNTPRSRRKGKRKAKRNERAKKSDSTDTSFSSPTRKKRKDSSDLNLSVENADLGSTRKKKGRSRKSPSKSASDDAARTPKEAAENVIPEAAGSSSKKRKKNRSPKKMKDASKSKKKSSLPDEDEALTVKKKKQKKRKSSSSEHADADSELQPKSAKKKSAKSKKKQKTPAVVKVRPLRSSTSKKSSSDSKTEHSQSQEQQEADLSPRKRPRKSNSPRRLLHS